MSDYRTDQDRFMRDLEKRQEYIEREAQARAAQAKLNEWSAFERDIRADVRRTRKVVRDSGFSEAVVAELNTMLEAAIEQRTKQILEGEAPD
jgi:hypothetical protein